MTIEVIDGLAPARPVQRSGRNQLLSGLPSRDFSLLLPDLVEVHLARGTVIHQPGQLVEHVYFIHEGLVSLLVSVSDGRSVEIAAIGREGALGAMAGLGSGFALNRAVVQLPVRAARIATGRLLAIAPESRAIRGMLVRYGDLLLMQVQQLVGCSAMHDVEARLSRWLLQAMDRHGSPLPLTQELMAQLLGVKRTTITMVSRILQVEGIIHVGRGVVHIRDAVALEKKACSCYHAMRDATEHMVESLTRQ